MKSKTKAQLIDELTKAHRKIARLENAANKFKKAEKALDESEGRLKSLLSSMVDLLFVFDEEGRFTSLHTAAGEDLYVPPEEFMGRPYRDVLPPHVAGLISDGLERNRQGETAEFDYPLEKQGVTNWYSAVMSPVLYDNLYSGSVGIVRNITERKRLEDELQESEETLRALYDGSPIPTFTWQLFGETFVLSDYNKAAKTTSLVNAGECVGLSFKIIFEQMPDIQDDFNQCISQRRVISRERSTQLPDTGETRHYALTYTFVEPDMVLFLAQDITTRRHSEKSLESERDNLRNIFESMADGIYIVDQQHNIQFVNQVIVTDFGIYEGKKCYEYFHDRNEICPWCKNQDVWAGKTVRWEWYSEKNGRTYDLIDTPMTLPDGNPGKLEIFRDITERKRMEEELKSSRERLRVLFESAPDAWYVHDAQGTIMDANRTALDMIGYSREELVGKNILKTNVLSPDEVTRAAASIKSIVRGELEGPDEYLMRRKDGTWITVEIMRFPVTIGNETLVMGSARDITVRKNMESTNRILRDLGLALNASISLDEGLRLCFEAAMEASGMDCGGIYLADEATGGHDLVFHRGLSPGFVESVSHFDADSDNTRLVLDGKPLYTKHLEVHLDISGIERSEGLLAFAVLPIRFEDRVIGCMNLASRNLREVPGASRAALETIAGQVGSAIARLRAEEALRKSEEMYRVMLETSPDAVTTTDMEGTITLASPRTAMLHGFASPDAMVGISALEFIIPEEHARAMENLRRTVLEGSVKDLEYTMKRKDGTTFAGELSASVIKDRQGVPAGLIAITKDVSARKNAESALRESEQRYRALIQQSAEAIYMFDPDTMRLLEANPTFLKYLGYTAEEIPELTIYDFIAHEKNTIDKFVRKIMATETFVIGERKWRRKNGELIDVLVTAGTIQHSGKDIIFIVGMDITARKRIEDALKESEEKFRELFESMSSGVAVYEAVDDGKDFIFRDFNRAGERIDDVKREDIIGKRVMEAFPEVEEFGLFEVLKRVWRTGKSEMFPATLYEDQRIIGWRESWIYKLSTGEVVAIYNDVTKRMQMEEELRESQRLEVLGKLASGVAHEVRNPLNAIMSLTEALCLDAGDDPEYEQYKEHIRGQVDRLSRLMSDLLDLGKSAADTSMQEEYISEICQASVELWKQSHPDRKDEIKLELTQDPAATAVKADSARIQQVILNLLDNAAQHSPPGGEINVFTCAPEKGMHCVYVKDAGPGIPENKLEQVFEPFYTTHKKGIGLGLSIVKRIIENHGGSVVVYNNDPPPGCTVEVRLPAAGGIDHETKHSSR